VQAEAKEEEGQERGKGSDGGRGRGRGWRCQRLVKSVGMCVDVCASAGFGDDET